MAYTKWLSAENGKNYRLPTEAEWEYAARGGTTTRFYWGDDANYNLVCANANIGSSGCNDGYSNTAPVGSFTANDYGLYDMIGNVWEWTCSNYKNPWDGSENMCNGSTADSTNRVIRGGCWLNEPIDIRSANRIWDSPSIADRAIGFRVVGIP